MIVTPEQYRRHGFPAPLAAYVRRQMARTEKVIETQNSPTFSVPPFRARRLLVARLVSYHSSKVP